MIMGWSLAMSDAGTGGSLVHINHFWALIFGLGSSNLVLAGRDRDRSSYNTYLSETSRSNINSYSYSYKSNPLCEKKLVSGTSLLD
jgi:hypothetical protein